MVTVKSEDRCGNAQNVASTTTAFVLYDLEFTAWEGSMARGWSGPGEYREVVQIGAVRLEPHRLAEIASLDLLVRPRLNPLLSDYFVALTGVTNEKISTAGIAFADAYWQFYEFCDGATMGCFGRDDLVLRENLTLYGLRDLPAPGSVVNLRTWIETLGIDLTGIHCGMIADKLKIDLPGRIHDALFDARALAAALRHLVAQGAPNPLTRQSNEYR